MSAARDHDALSGTVPGWSLRALFAAIGLVLVFVGVPDGPWTAIAALLIGVAVWRPRWLTAWVVIGVLMLSALVEPGTFTPRLLGLIAGVHALHLVAAWMLVVPAAARLQPAVLLPSLRRFVLVQLPVQAAAVLLLLPGARASVPALAILSGIALAGLVGMFVPPLLRRPRRTDQR
ncbi:hypothetical protein [Leifsonia shinshuensis]|uniref:hypothetical protein n=1 Tax=Leifsonia shinshuensis TaxID=150026 RepID=UPI0028586433|nr:hypothetical protein [Leifsonia shinshuensis]MDR6970666.1 hypothetical protein [Leifsonia shinshuensis]